MEVGVLPIFCAQSLVPLLRNFFFTFTQQSAGQLDLREEYLSKVKEVVSLQLRLDQETRKGIRLTADLEMFRSAAREASEEAGQHKGWLER